MEDEKEPLELRNVEPFVDAILIGNGEEKEDNFMEDEKAASILNPNIADNRRLFQNRIFHVDWDTSIPTVDQPDLLEAHGLWNWISLRIGMK